MMVNKARNAMQRHGARTHILDIEITKQLITNLRSNSKNTVDVIFIFHQPRTRQSRKRFIIVCKMPTVKRLCKTTAHLTTYTRGLITVFIPARNVTKDFIIFSSTLSKNLFIANTLFTKICKYRDIIISDFLSRPESFNSLLIGVVISCNTNTDNKTMLDKRFTEIKMIISSKGISRSSTLRSIRTSTSTRVLNNLRISPHTREGL